jgi:hypothetical protein
MALKNPLYTMSPKKCNFKATLKTWQIGKYLLNKGFISGNALWSGTS